MTVSAELAGGRTNAARPSVRIIALGLLVIQGVWILAVPPFRASDEFDHVYQASAVSRGDWRPEPANATRGTGAFVTVPGDIVAAARAECERLPYTDAADCVGEPRPDGTEVATGAGRYHPLFYAVVGTPALPFEGATALYVMRIVATLCCWIALVAAFVALKAWSRTSWPYLALVVCISPVVLFTTTVVAPNGLEMASAAALWAALTGLLKVPDSPRRGTLLLIGTAAAAVLVTLRSMGPFWALLICVAVVAAEPRRWAHLRQLLRAPGVWLAATTVFVATLASLAWILTADSLVIGKLPEPPDLTPAQTFEAYWKSVAAWVFQSIGAFPYRNAPAPTVTYVCYLLLVSLLTAFALRSATRTERTVIGSVMVLALAIPLVITLRTFDLYGISWQGRYTIPLSMGFIFLSGVALENSRAHLRREAILLAGALFTVAQAVSPAWLARIERRESPGVASGDWVLAPPLALGLVAATACLVMWYGATRSTRDDAAALAPEPRENARTP